MYFIGIDGGGTKTESVVSGLDGKIVGRGVSSSSNLRDVGVERAVFSIADSVCKAFLDVKEKEIEVALIGIPSFAEEFGEKKEEIKSLILERLKEEGVFVKKIEIVSDQEVAFVSGTDKKEGVVVISGTGSVARGWNKGKDVKTSGWGYLADEGGAFQVGQKAYQKFTEALDGRAEETLLTEMIKKEFGVKNIADLNKLVYCDKCIEFLSSLSVLVDKAAEGGDSMAKSILIYTAKELAVTTKNTIRKLDFKERFPLVLVGGMFKSRIFSEFFKEYITMFSSLADVIIPEKSPAEGALKIAVESYKKCTKN
jgi:N-acetylglucosamine kinase-like BadF-type ATPase